MNRECGSCTACCTTMIVPELNKAANLSCKYAENGCGIYNDRPSTCASWDCLWLKGHFRDRDRPDKSGFVSWVMPASSVRMWGHPVVAMRETKEGATVMKNAESAIKKLNKNNVSVIVIRRESGRSIYPAAGFSEKMRKSFKSQDIKFTERSGAFHVSREECEAMWPIDYAEGEELRKLIKING